jgi:hypothetical protein
MCQGCEPRQVASHPVSIFAQAVRTSFGGLHMAAGCCGEGPVADFPAWLSENGMGVTTKPDRSDVTPISPVGPPSLYQSNYAKRALGNACYELRHCPEGSRNTKLNALAYKMGRLIVRGWITRELAENYLLKSCEACGLLADDGAAQCRATPASGINAGTTQPYHDIGPRHD